MLWLCKCRRSVSSWMLFDFSWHDTNVCLMNIYVKHVRLSKVNRKINIYVKYRNIPFTLVVLRDWNIPILRKIWTLGTECSFGNSKWSTIDLETILLSNDFCFQTHLSRIVTQNAGQTEDKYWFILIVRQWVTTLKDSIYW